MQSHPSDSHPHSTTTTTQSPASVGTPTTPGGVRKRGCTCKKSSCLKLYCECFASNTRCGERCQCLGCKNKEHNRLEIAHAIQAIEKRTQKAFRSPARSTKKLQHFYSTTLATSMTDLLDTSAASMNATSASESTGPTASAVQLHGHHLLRETCACQGGICTTACPCLARFGGCEPTCPCKGCQMLQVTKTKGCSCKKSGCLKLYCECLAAQRVCTARCHCECCKNRPEHHVVRDRAVAAILERNPLAFQPKVASGASQHLRGCNCRKSGCMKNYCECHQAGVLCTARCACHQCRNTELLVPAKTKVLSHTLAGALRPDAAMQLATAASNTDALTSQASNMTPLQPPFTPSRAPRSSTALDLLSRSAPSAAHIVGARQGATTPSKRDADGGIALRSRLHLGYLTPHLPNGGVQPLFTKRKYSKVSARPLFLDGVMDAADAGRATLPSVDATVEREFAAGDSDDRPALATLCRSLLHAALTVDTLSTSSRAAAQSPEVVGSNGVKSPRRRASVSSDVAMSPSTNDLLCVEDMDTPGGKATALQHSAQSSGLSSEDATRQAAQERAVLQEVCVWLRTLTAAAHPSERR